MSYDYDSVEVRELIDLKVNDIVTYITELVDIYPELKFEYIIYGNNAYKLEFCVSKTKNKTPIVSLKYAYSHETAKVVNLNNLDHTKVFGYVNTPTDTVNISELPPEGLQDLYKDIYKYVLLYWHTNLGDLYWESERKTHEGLKKILINRYDSSHLDSLVF